MDTIPHLSEDLINELDRLYPLRNPKQTEPYDSIVRRAGARDVVEMLRSRQVIEAEEDNQT